MEVKAANFLLPGSEPASYMGRSCFVAEVECLVRAEKRFIQRTLRLPFVIDNIVSYPHKKRIKRMFFWGGNNAPSPGQKEAMQRIPA